MTKAVREMLKLQYGINEFPYLSHIQVNMFCRGSLKGIVLVDF